MKSSLDQNQLIYYQIAQGLEEDIVKGHLEEGEQVMSTNQIARRYQINPATAAKGINLLVDKGILYKRRGLGMYVAEGAREIIRRERKESFYWDYVQPLLQEAKLLGMSVKEVVELIKEKEEYE